MKGIITLIALIMVSGCGSSTQCDGVYDEDDFGIMCLEDVQFWYRIEHNHMILTPRLKNDNTLYSCTNNNPKQPFNMILKQ